MTVVATRSLSYYFVIIEKKINFCYSTRTRSSILV